MLPETEQYYFCKFGEQVVIAEHSSIDGGVGTFVCLTPETPAAKQVNVSFSIDGISFTKPAAKQFAFHNPLIMQNISPSVGSIGGGTSVLVSLAGDVVSRKTESSILKPTCNFDGMKSRGTLVSSPDGSTISCTVPSIFTLGHADLSVSLNGIDYSVNTGNFTIVLTEEYNEVVKKVTTHAMAGDPVFHVNGTSSTGEFYGFFDMKFYDFYGFYGPSKDVSFKDKTSEVCMVAVSPSLGRNAGGTVVTVKLAGVIPEGQETFFCKFGDKVVLADSFYYTEDVSPAVVCTAPEFGSGAGAVELKISFDGITYTKSGSAFYYHDDVKIDNILPSIGTHIGGTTVGVRLANSPMPSSFEVGLTSVPALCKFDAMEVSGQYVVTNDGPAVVCKTPPSELGVVNVKISLDGQYYSSDSVAFTYTLDPDEVNLDHRMAVSRYLVEADPDMATFKNESFYFYNDGMNAADSVKELSFYEFYAFYDLGAIPFDGANFEQAEIAKIYDYLPFSPDYCLFFNVGPDTSLEKFDISNGTLFPAFSPSTFVYVTSVVKEVTCLNITAFPTDKNVRSVVAAGHKMLVDSTTDCLPLSVGENLLDVVVTGQDGVASRTYSLVAVRLQGTKAGLKNVTVDDGTSVLFPPDFNTSTLDYTITVGVDVTEVTLTPIPEDPDALVTVVVNGVTTYFGGQEPKIALNAGDNVFEIEVEAEDGILKTIYTVKVHRESTDLLSLVLTSDAAGNNPISLSPAFSASTLVYTANAAPTDSTFFLTAKATAAATVDIAYDIGATGYSCPAGTVAEGTLKNVPPTADEYCNPAGTNTLTITIKYGSLSSTYSVSVKRTSAAASLASLVGSAGTFVPAFNTDVYEYELLLKHTTSAFTLTPTVATGAQTTVAVSYGSTSFSLSSGSASSTISSNVCGEMDLITIEVTAEDGISKLQYKILPVKMAEIIHSSLAGISFVNATAGSVAPAFSPGVGAYDLTVIRSHKTGTDVAVGTDPVELSFDWNAAVTYSSYGNFVGYTSKVIMQESGVNTTLYNHGDASTNYKNSFTVASGSPRDIQFFVEACDGRATGVYDLDLARGQGSNDFLCSLVPSAGTFDSAFTKTDTSYKVEVATSATSIAFTPTTCDSFAKIEVGACSSNAKTAWTSGATYTKTLSSDFTVVQVSTAEFCVTSEDGVNKRTYSVLITRPLSSEALLASLKVNLVKWDGTNSETTYTKTETVDIATALTASATYQQPYIQITAAATIATAVIELTTPDGVTTTLTGGVASAVLPSQAGCVAPSLYYCDLPASICPELPFGPSTISVKVKSQDGVTSTTYTLVVTRAAVTYASALQDMFIIGHPILGMTELVAASGLTQNTISANFLSQAGLDTATVTKYGTFVASEHILTALASKSALPPSPANLDSRFRAVTSPRAQFLNDIADKMVADQTLVDRVSSGYTFADVSTATLGEGENDSSPRVYLQPLYSDPYQNVKVQGVSVTPGCGRSLEADFGDNDYKVEVFDGQLVELKQYNVTVKRPYLPSGLLSDIVSTVALDQAFANTTFTYSTTVEDTAEDVTMSFSKYVSTSSVVAQLFYNGVLQSTVSVTSATKFDLSPFGNTTVVALVQTADGTDGGAYAFNFNKFPTILTSLTTELADGTALSLSPAFVDPSVTTVQTVQTSYVLSEVTVTEVFLGATALDGAATLAVAVDSVAVTADTTTGKYKIALATDTVVVTVTVTGSNGVATRVYTLTVTKELKNAAAAQSSVSFVADGVSTTFGAGTAYIPISGKTASGKDALTGTFSCQVTGDTTTFDQTVTSVFQSSGKFQIPLQTTVTIAGTYSYACTLGGVAIGSGTGKITIIGGATGDKSILTLVSTEAVRGSVVEFSIRTKDAYGNEVNTVKQATEFTVTVTQVDTLTTVPVTFNSTETANGLIYWYFTPDLTYSGQYKVLATVKVGGLDTEIIGSGISMSTTIPVTAASGWQVVALPAYMAGGVQNVVVQPKAGTTAFKEQVILASISGDTRTGPFTKTYSCASRATVQCTIPLGLTITGNYTLNVTIGESLVGDKLHPIFVSGGSVDPLAVAVVIPATVSAGVDFNSEIKLVDIYGNPASVSTLDTTQMSASFTQGALTVVPTAVTSECYFYDCKFVLTAQLIAEGDWTGQIFYQFSPVGLPKTVTVTAGSAVASKTSVTVLQELIVAGFPMPLTAVPKDAFGNVIKVSSLAAADKTFEAVIISDDLVKTTTFDITGEVFTADIVITKNGKYNIIFKLGGKVAFEHKLDVVVGAVALNMTQIVKPTGIPAGTTTGFYATFFDAHGNRAGSDSMSFGGTTVVPVSAALGGALPQFPVISSAQFDASLDYYFSFLPFVAGTYKLDLYVDSVLVPLDVTDYMTVTTGPPSSGLSTVEGNVLGATAGVKEVAFVTVRDTYGNTDTTGKAVVQAFVLLTDEFGISTPVTSTVVFNAVTNVYDVSYTSTKTGALSVAVSVDGEFLMTTLNTKVSPGPFDPTKSTVTGDVIIVRNQDGILTLQAKDAYGNALTTGGAPVIGFTNGFVHSTLTTDNQDGTYTIKYSFADETTPQVTVELFDFNTLVSTPITVLDITVKLSSGTFNLAASTLVPAAATVIVAGQSGTATVSARDDQGVLMGVGGLQWSATAKNTVSLVEVPISYSYTDLATGVYDFSYTITTAGTYEVTIANTPTFDETFTADKVLGKFTITVGPSSADGLGTVYTGAPAQIFEAGDAVKFTFDLYDAFNNSLGLALTEQALTGVTAYVLQGALKTPLAVSFATGVGAEVTGTITIASQSSTDFGSVFVDVGGVEKQITTFLVMPGKVSQFYKLDTVFVKTAGVSSTAALLFEDAFLNPVGGGLISACVAKATFTHTNGTLEDFPLVCTLSDTTDDVFVTTSLTKAGVYEVSYSITQDIKVGTHTKVFTETVYVEPAAASVATSFITGIDFKQITAGEPDFYTLTLVDAFGNVLKDFASQAGIVLDYKVDATMTIGGVPAILKPAPQFTELGVYEIPFGAAESLILEPSDIKLDVSINTVALLGSPFTIPASKILPALTSVEGTIVRYGALTLSGCTALVESACLSNLDVEAGTSETIQVYAYNTLGIPQVFKQELVSASARVVAKVGQTVDADDTGLTAEPVVTYLTGQGIYNVTFSAAVFSNADAEVLYAVDILMNAGSGFLPIPMSTVYFTVKPTAALPSASKIVATLSKIADYTTLSKRYLFAHNQINTNDKYGNQAVYDPANPILITATAVGPTDAAIYIEPILDASGAISGQYLLGLGTPMAGTYFITIVINGVSLEAYSVTIEAGALDPLSIAVTSSDSVAGTAATGKLTGLDAFGNQLKAAKLTTALTGATVAYKVKMISKGKVYDYTQSAQFLSVGIATPTVIDFTYTPKLEGTLEITADVTVSGAAAPVSASKKYAVSAGAVDVASSKVAGPALAGFLENTGTYFTVELNDANGNTRVDECAKVTVDISETTTLQAAPSPTVTATAGACLVTFALPTGTYSVAVKYAGAAVSTFTSSAVAIVGDPDLASTLVAGLGYGDVAVEAGSNNTFSVSLVAANGLLVPESQGATYVQVNVADVAGTVLPGAADVTDNLNGEYAVKYNVEVVGNYTLSLLVGGQLYGVPHTVEVLPSKTFAQNVTLSVPTIAPAGSVFLPVNILDTYGNNQTYDLYNMDDMQIFVTQTFETYIVELESGKNGENGAEITLTTAGVYTLEFFYEDTLVSKSALIIDATDVSVSNSIVYGEGLSSAQAGVQGSFFIELYDAFDNLVTNPTAGVDFVNDCTATFIKVGNATVTVPVTLSVSPLQQAIKATYSLTTTGDYYLSLVLIDEETTPPTSTTYTSFAGYVSTTVSAGLATAQTIQATQFPASPYAGNVNFQILVEDTFGNTITTDQFLNLFIVARGTGAALGEVSIASADDITWAGDKYVVSMLIPASGTYDLEISRGVEAIKGSPYPLTIAAAPIYPAYTLVEGTGIANFTAGEAVSVTVKPRDVFNNTVALSGTESFSVEYRYSTGEIVKATGVAQSDNSLLFSGYSVTKAEDGLDVAVLYNDGLEITTVGSFDVSVSPEATVSAAKTVVSLSGAVAGTAVAGSKIEINVYPADQYGNAITVATSTGFGSFLVLTGTPEPATMDETFVVGASGTVLTQSITLTVSGTYTGNVKYLGTNLLETALSLKIDTSDVVISKTTVTGPAAGTIVAGVPSSFELQFMDKYDNVLSELKAFMDAAALTMPVQVDLESVDASILSRSFNVITNKYVITAQSSKTGVMTLKYVVDGAQIYQAGSTPYTYPVGPSAFSTAQTTVFGLDVLTTGQTETFYIEPRDTLANKFGSEPGGVFTVTTGAAGITPAVVFNAATGVYEVTFTTGNAESLGLTGAATESTLSLEVLYDGTVFKTLSTKTFLAAGTISATNSLMVDAETGVTLEALPAYKKGFSTAEDVSFNVVFKDTNGIAKPLTTAEVSNARASIVPAPPTAATLALNADGSLSVKFATQVATDYAVQVFYNDVAVQGGALVGFRVSAGPASVADSFVSLDTTTALTPAQLASPDALVAGVTSSLYVIANDAKKNLQDASSPRANVIATMVPATAAGEDVTGVVVKVKDLSLVQSVFHIYQIDFGANLAGDYTVTISMGATVMATLQYTVGTGEFAPAKTVLAVNAPEVAVQTDYVFTAFDLYDNKKATADISFALQFVKGTTTVSGTATFDGTLQSGTHKASVTFVESGSYELTVTSGGASVLTKTVIVKAGPVIQATSTFSGLDGLTAGALATVTIVPRDVSGNLNLVLPTVTFAPAGDYKLTATLTTTGVTLALTPSVFGTVTLTADFEGSAITSTFSVNPSAPPVLQTVKMASLTAITATFDIATNMGNMGASGDCALVLASATVAKLGTGAYCSFSSTKTLAVTLGSEASILPVGSTAPDVLVLKENAVANAAGNSYNATGSQLVQAPDVVVTPLVAAKAPSTVGICEDLTIDASASSGSGGRNLVFGFQVEGLGDKILSLSSLLKGLANTQSIADIDKNSMNIGINYNFIVTATNFLGQTTTAKIPVFRADQQVPTIFIEGKSTLKTESSSKITVPCRAEMPGDFLYDSALKTCVKNDGGDLFPVNFSWKADKTKATFDASGLPVAFASTLATRDFTIPSNYLEAGKTYGFECTGADAAAPERKQSATVEIEVEYSAYEVLILGGSRTASATEDLYLEAEVQDPNDAPFPVRYAWDVTSSADPNFKKPAAFYSDSALSEGKITLGANSLPAGKYVFTVTASKEPLTAIRSPASTSVTIEILEEKVLSLSIEDQLTSKTFKPSKTLQLVCRVDTTDLLGLKSFSWSMTSSTGDEDLGSKVEGGQAALSNYVLVIPGGKLQPGVDYTFTCKASDVGTSVSGETSKTIRTESVPSSGKVLLSKITNGKTFADATIDIAAGLGDVQLIAKDWVSDAEQIYYEFHAIEVNTGLDILLGTPSAANAIVSSLPAGTYDFKVYIKNDLEAASAMDVVSGAVYTLAERVVVGDIMLAISGRRRLQQTANSEQEQLYYRFQVASAEGDVPKALSFARIFGDAYGGAAKTQNCLADAAVKTIKNAMLTELTNMDKSVVPSNEYIGLQACAFNGLLYVPGEQVLTNVKEVNNIFSSVLSKVANTSEALNIAPSEGDAYECFYKSLDSVFNYFKSDCDSAGIGSTFLKTSSDAVANLAEAMSQNTFGGVVTSRDVKNFDIYASGISASAKLSGKYPLVVNTTGISSPYVAYIDGEEILNDSLILSEIVALGVDEDSNGSFAVPEAALAAVPAGYEPALKYWTGSFDSTTGKAVIADISALPEGLDKVSGVYTFELPLTAGEHVYVVFYAIEIKLGLNLLEFFAPEYSYTTPTGQLTSNIELTPPFSMKNFEYSVTVTNLQPIAEFKAQVAVEGISLTVSKTGSEYVNVTSSALATGTPTKFVAGDIDVHEVDECTPGGTCKVKNNTYEFKLEKGGETKSYYVSIFRTASTQSQLADLKLQAVSVYEQLYNDKKEEVAYSSGLTKYAAYVYSSVTAATVEAKAEANAPYPFGPGGAHIVVTGPGAVGALGAVKDWGNSSASVGSSEPNSADNHILIGRNPVSVGVTSQDASSDSTYSIDIYRMGKPVSITERFAGLNANEFINDAKAQEAFINAKAAQLGIQAYQIEILLVKSGSVIIEYVIYPVVETLRDPTLDAAAKAAVETEVTKANILAADTLATNVLSKSGEVLDFGQYGTAASEIQKSATPPITRPDDLPCPACPVGYTTTTETNSDGLSYCSCKLPPSGSKEELGDGEIAGIVIGCLVFVAGVGLMSIVIYRRRRQAQQVLSGSDDEEETGEGDVDNSGAGEETETEAD